MDAPRVLEHLLITRIVRFHATVQGVVTGLVLGLIVFMATIWLVIKGAPWWALLGQYFIGYRVTVTGSLIGFAWGFVVGFALGFFVTATYNWLTDLRHRSAPRA